MKMTQRTKIIGVVEMIEKHKLQDGLKVAVLNDRQNFTQMNMHTTEYSPKVLYALMHLSYFSKYRFDY